MAVITMEDLIEVVPERSEGNTQTLTGTLSAGQRLVVESAPHGDEIVDALVPEGKEFKYRIVVYGELVDA